MMNIVKLSLILLLSGCVSQIQPFREYTNSWIGEPVDRLMAAKHRPQSFASRTGWKEKKYKIDNGWVYVSPETEGCIIHWHVNQEGIIVSYHTEGTRCDW